MRQGLVGLPMAGLVAAWALAAPALAATHVQPFSQTGTIQRIVPGAVEMQNEFGETYLVKLSPAPGQTAAITVVAPCSRDAIQAGATVRFQGVLAEDGSVAGVADLYVSQQKLRRKPQPQPVQGETVPAGTMLIVGEVKSFDNDTLTVDIARGQVTATVPAYATVRQAGVDPKLVAVGDKIQVSGFSRAPSNLAPQYFARQAVIELATPVAERTK